MITKQEAEAVYAATIRNCQRMQPKFAPKTAQATLLQHRIAALQTVAALVADQSPDEAACARALAPIQSIIHKLSVAQAKHAPDSPTYRRLAPMLAAMRLGETLLLTRRA